MYDLFMSIMEGIEKYQAKMTTQTMGVGAEAAIATPFSDLPMSKRFTAQERRARRILIESGASPAELEAKFPSKI